MKPEIYVEFTLVFDNDFDVTKITNITGMIPYECKNRAENRINPITNKHLEGFWTVRSSVYTEFDAEKALNDIVTKIVSQTDDIVDICHEYDGEAIFRVVSWFNTKNTPAIYFERNFLDIVQKLNATIQINLYI